MNVYVLITVTMVILLRDFGPYAIILMTVFTTFHIPVITDKQFTSINAFACTSSYSSILNTV